MGEIYKRPYLVRRAAKGGKEVTLAPDTPFEVGDKIVQWYNGFVLIVPHGAKVDEESLKRAIDLPKKEQENEKE